MEWIKVKEKYPPIDQVILMYSPPIQTSDPDVDRGPPQGFSVGYMKSRVTYWTEIPKIPED